MFFSRAAGLKYVHRGDPSIIDFNISDLNVEGTWTDIDLSGIIPVGTKVVLLYILVKESVGGKSLRIKRVDVNENANLVTVYPPTTTLNYGFSALVSLTATRKISYFKSAGTWTKFDMTISAWVV